LKANIYLIEAIYAFYLVVISTRLIYIDIIIVQTLLLLFVAYLT
jgi:hypothetical protein